MSKTMAPGFRWHVFETELNWMAGVWSGDRLQRLSFGQGNPQTAAARVGVSGDLLEKETAVMRDARQLLKRFAGGEAVCLNSIKVDWAGRTQFQRKVLSCCRRIPWGTVLSYGQVAAQCGKSRAARAVGSVMRANRHPLIIPCHRVISANGRLGGYSAHDGLATKRTLLKREGIVTVG
jgi:methylated-DNA-[protein]-cysteine S-methyltransferase